MICTNYHPLKHNILLCCDLNKELLGASSSTSTKSTDRIWTESTIIFVKKVLSTESCPPCLMCFVQQVPVATPTAQIGAQRTNTQSL